MTVVAIHQPCYIPWLPFFEKIKKSDVFVFLDDVQYQKNGWQNRNKIRTNDGSIWLTIPVNAHFKSKSNEIKIDYTQNWVDKHKKSFLINYSKAKYFNENWKDLEKIYDMNFETLTELNLEIISFIQKKFNIETKIMLSSELDISSSSSERILDICKKLDADVYYSGQGYGMPEKKYLDEEDFLKNNIETKFQNFIFTKYEQCYEPFIPNLTSLDLLFNEGQNSIKYL